MKLKKYRIVRDNYLGYEAQIWRLWWPFWTEIKNNNTHQTIEEAERFIKGVKKEVVKYVEF